MYNFIIPFEHSHRARSRTPGFESPLRRPHLTIHRAINWEQSKPNARWDRGNSKPAFTKRDTETEFKETALPFLDSARSSMFAGITLGLFMSTRCPSDIGTIPTFPPKLARSSEIRRGWQASISFQKGSDAGVSITTVWFGSLVARRSFAGRLRRPRASATALRTGWGDLAGMAVPLFLFVSQVYSQKRGRDVRPANRTSRRSARHSRSRVSLT
jgi:hypothetical protein